jgi:hypothetical protein
MFELLHGVLMIELSSNDADLERFGCQNETVVGDSDNAIAPWGSCQTCVEGNVCWIGTTSRESIAIVGTLEWDQLKDRDGKTSIIEPSYRCVNA